MIVRVSSAGSSPRGRGTGAAHRSPDRKDRFIPAWAGNSLPSLSLQVPEAVHPRVGGEQMRTSPMTDLLSGSSPRGRGTVRGDDRVWLRRRFIPAWAGNRTTGQRPLTGPPVHPRVGGEQGSLMRADQDFVGSSPRGRGTVVMILVRHGTARFIPAWAGNSRPCDVVVKKGAVHPRVGGEQPNFSSDSNPASGSSPRGRGTGPRAWKTSRWSRFIPAWAGNSRPRSRPDHRFAVHPRVGGEQWSASGREWQAAGSSPRGRGTGGDRGERIECCRFIPAWAGNRLRVAY